MNTPTATYPIHPGQTAAPPVWHEPQSPVYPPAQQGYANPHQPYPPMHQPPPPAYFAQPVYVTPVFMAPGRSKSAAALLCFFFGGLGIHRFYTGQTGLGIALLLTTLVLGPLTLGLWFIVTFVWIVVDFILILSGGVTDQYGRPLT